MTDKERRNPMDANTDPTDEELAIVIHEAGDLARQRQKQTEQWIQEQLAKALSEVKERERGQLHE